MFQAVVPKRHIVSARLIIISELSDCSVILSALNHTTDDSIISFSATVVGYFQHNQKYSLVEYI